MEFAADKQAVVDALYLLLHTKGYVPQEVILDALSAIASAPVAEALALLDAHENRREAERQAKLDAMNEAAAAA